MTDIELVIKIPKAYYEMVLERCKDPVLLNAFKNGTPLPKGHGRLIDASKLNDVEIYDRLNDIYGASMEQIMNAETIVEADKES